MRKNLIALVLGTAFALLVLEICCQVYTLSLVKHWREIEAHPGHYFSRSENPTLGYELKQDYRLRRDGNYLELNEHGIRDLVAEIALETTEIIAVLGDSVVFGIGFSQEETIASLLQGKLTEGGRPTRVLNLGVPGYGLRELGEFLDVKSGIYDWDRLVYVLNPNDFARRDSVYEGADNGLYRMYHLPSFKTPWFVRKAFYRLKKNKQGRPTSVTWYRWLYNGNKKFGLEILVEIGRLARQRGGDFMVVLLPAGCAYVDDNYALSDVYAEIASYAKSHGIHCVDPTAEFQRAPELFFDETDHLLPAGNELMAEVLARELEGRIQQTEAIAPVLEP